MEQTFKRSNRPNCMLMPVEVYAKTAGKQSIETKKKQGKAIFLGRTAFTEVNVRSGSYSEDIVKELEIGKENEGKCEKVKAEGKKTTMQINTKEEDGSVSSIR